MKQKVIKVNRKLPFFYYFSRTLLSGIFKLYYNPTIIGKENIPKTGRIIIAGNHKHLFDQCLTIISTKRGIHYLAKNEYFKNNKISWFFKKTGCIPVDRKRKDPNAKALATSVLKDEGAIGIFPEGTRNRTKNIILPFKYGAVSLAQKTDSYIIPFGITGEYKFRSKNLTIRYDKPFKVNNMTIEEANAYLQDKVKELIERNLEMIKVNCKSKCNFE